MEGERTMPINRNTTRFGLAFAAALAVGPVAAPAQAPPAGPPLQLEWLGQTAEDRVGDPNLPVGNGVNDLCLAVDEASMSAGLPIQWSVYCDGMLNRYRDFAWPPTAKPMGAISVERRDGKVLLYFDAFLTVPGDLFRVTATYGDGHSQTGQVMSGGVDFGKEIRWIGQAGQDFVGAANKPDGCDDWEIDVFCPRLNAANVRRWRVWLDYHSQDDYFHDVWSGDRDGNPVFMGDKAVKSVPHGQSAKLYINPALAREGDQFAVEAVMDDGRVMGWVLAGGGTDWGTAAVYRGRGETDAIGPKTGDPNGVDDIGLDVFDPSLSGVGVRRAAVITDGVRWTWPAVEEGDRFLDVKPAAGALHLTIDNPNDRGGAFVFACAVLNNGKMIGWSVSTSRTNNSTDATWLGQLADYVGPGKGEPDGELDFAIRVASPLLAESQPLKWRVECAGRVWGADDGGGATLSPAAVETTGPPTERVVYFTEAMANGNSPITRGEKFVVTATQADGGVLHWRLASPGSPRLKELAWEKATKTRYVVSFGASGPGLTAARVAGPSHIWRNGASEGAADLEMNLASNRMKLMLDRSVSALAPGDRIAVEGKDATGKRYYGYLFAGSVAE